MSMLALMGLTGSGTAWALAGAAGERLEQVAGTVAREGEEQTRAWQRAEATRQIDWDSQAADLFRQGLTRFGADAEAVGRSLDAAAAELRLAADEVRQKLGDIGTQLARAEGGLEELAADAGHGVESVLHSDGAQRIRQQIESSGCFSLLGLAQQALGQVGAGIVGAGIAGGA